MRFEISLTSWRHCCEFALFWHTLLRFLTPFLKTPYILSLSLPWSRAVCSVPEHALHVIPVCPLVSGSVFRSRTRHLRFPSLSRGLRETVGSVPEHALCFIPVSPLVSGFVYRSRTRPLRYPCLSPGLRLCVPFLNTPCVLSQSLPWSQALCSVPEHAPYVIPVSPLVSGSVFRSRTHPLWVHCAYRCTSLPRAALAACSILKANALIPANYERRNKQNVEPVSLLPEPGMR
jgi:hypothetical protein